VAATTELFEAGKHEAFTAADRAVALRPDLSDGFVQRGYLRAWVRWDFVGADEDFKHGLALEPENASARAAYGTSVLLPTGRAAECRAVAAAWASSDPLNASAWRALGITEYYLGNLPAAREALSRSLKISPQQTNAAAFVAFSLLKEGRPSEALEEASRSPSEVFRLTPGAMAYHDLGREAESQRELNALIAKYQGLSAYQIAEVFAWRGEADRAFEWLDKAYAQHDGGLTVFRDDPLLTRLHKDARFAALLQKMKLPPLGDAT
jgi:tetratricopeptide (TPR) repeat protein